MTKRRVSTQLPRARVLFEARAVAHRLMTKGLEIALYHREKDEPEHPAAVESAAWLTELSVRIDEQADELEAQWDEGAATRIKKGKRHASV